IPLASGFAGDAGALPIRAEARVLGATLKSGDSVEYALGATRHGYLVPAKGSVEVNGVRIEARDGAAISGENAIKIKGIGDAEILLVDTDWARLCLLKTTPHARCRARQAARA